MPWPKYKSGPVDFWFTEALTQFLNGFLSGWKSAVGTGAGTGAVTGLNPDLAANLTAVQQIFISLATVFLAMLFKGADQVSRWHETNPLPNPWPKPTGNTVPPFLPDAPT